VAALVGGAGAVALTMLGTLPLVVAAQMVLGAAFAFVPPSIAAITLGMVGGAALAGQQGRNQAWNAGGNVAFAVIAGLLGYFAALSWIFYFVGLLGILTAVFSYTIKKRDIDDKIARQAPEDDEAQASSTQSGVAKIKKLLADRRIVVMVITVFLWNLANAAMLVLLGEILPKGKGGGASLFLSAGIIAAQIIMIGAALAVPPFSKKFGRKPIFLFAMSALVARGVLFAIAGKHPYLLVAIQSLDGLGAGVYNVIWLLIIADIGKGTGRFNLLQGVTITGFGLGGAFSNLVAGFIAQRFGFPIGFLCLAARAGVAFALFLLGMPETKPADGKTTARAAA